MPERQAVSRRHWGPVLLAVSLALLAARLWLIAPSPPAAAQDSRALQLWPDRIAGVASGQLVGPAVVTGTAILPVGVCYGPGEVAVRGRTYLHFPMAVFPPGSEIRRATLHLYLDGRSGPGTARLGVYRVLDAWRGVTGSDPATWPSLLNSPIGVTRLNFGTPVPTEPISPTPTLTPSPTTAPTATLTPSPTPTATVGPTPTPTLSPTPRPTVPVSLEKVPGRWLSWDVTVLLRSWLAGETSNDGLAVASAPRPDALPEEAGDLLAAQRLVIAPDNDTRPYLIVEFDVYTPTPTPTGSVSPLPTPTPIIVLPPAGASAVRVTWADGVTVGAALLLVCLVWWRSRAGSRRHAA